jgi:ubiquinone/menaquinone biosynthesis C-methylase UbiE
MQYDRPAAEAYEVARSMPLEALTAWRTALTPYLTGSNQRPVLDLGSGTGLFAHALAVWFERDVVGVEPSEEMRRQAELHRSHPRITYLAGRAADMPLADSGCDVAWLSTVIHHIPDLAACAAELRRVLRPGARILIRSAFPGRLDRITLFKYFPAAMRIAKRFPSVEAVARAFAPAGFEVESLESIPQPSAPTLRAFRARIEAQRRADSTLRSLTNEDFDSGLATLERALMKDSAGDPVVDWLDLLVLRGRSLDRQAPDAYHLRASSPLR